MAQRNNMNMSLSQNIIDTSATSLCRNLQLLKSFKFPDYYPSYIQTRNNNVDNICYDFDYIGSTVSDDSISFKNFTFLSSYLLITNAYLLALSSFIGRKKCLEIMCGTGCLTYGLRKYGVDIIPTTERNSKSNYYIGRDWCNDIIDIDAIKAIELYGKDIDYVITSFPCPTNSLDYRSIEKMREINPNCKMIYIGNVLHGNETYVSTDFCHHIRDKKRMIFLTEINHFMYHRYGIFDYTYIIQ